MLEKIFEQVKSEFLTPEIKKSITTLVEAKISEQTKIEKEKLEANYKQKIDRKVAMLESKAVQYVDQYLVEKLDSYCDYVADEWVKKNKLAIDSGIKANLYESMIDDLKDVMSKNSIKPEEVGVVEKISKESKKLNEELNAITAKNIEMKKEIKGLKALKIFEAAAADLSTSEKEKVKKLVGDFSIDDLSEFKNKVRLIVESRDSFTEDEENKDVDFSSDVNIESTKENLTESLAPTKGNYEAHDYLSAAMKYLAV